MNAAMMTEPSGDDGNGLMERSCATDCSTAAALVPGGGCRAVRRGERGVGAGEVREWLTRREWVRCFALGWAAAAVGLGGRRGLLADISPGADKANLLSLRLADYPVLQGSYGSMRFSLFGDLVVNGVITITRVGLTNGFHAMSAYCTHQGCIVKPYETGDTNAMICDCHGSVYDIEGRVITPAEDGQPDLPRYATSFANGMLQVEVPGLNLRVNSVAQATDYTGGGGVGTQRFRLTFPVRSGGRYRVRFTPDLVTAAVPVSYATSVNGALTSAVIAPTANGTRTVWVQSSAVRGFYVVELVVEEYVI